MKDQLTITASNEGNDQRRKRKEGKGKGKRRKEGEEPHKSTEKPNESSEKDRPPISVCKKASVLKNDQVEVKEEKLGKKSKTSHEVPVKKCK